MHERINHFLDNVLQNVTVLENGLIYHEFDFEPIDLYARVRKVGIKRKIKRQIMGLFAGKTGHSNMILLSPEKKKGTILGRNEA